jgi:hypothetical protein
MTADDSRHAAKSPDIRTASRGITKARVWLFAGRGGMSAEGVHCAEESETHAFADYLARVVSFDPKRESAREIYAQSLTSAVHPNIENHSHYH